MATEEIVAGTQISGLPDLVLHHILSFLPVEDAARTSILSKRWSRLWDTLPYLNFGEGFMNLFIPTPKIHPELKQLKKNKSLLDVAEGIILRRSSQPNAGIVKLCLTIQKYQLSKRQRLRKNPLDFKLDRWMSCVARSSLRELKLRITFKIGHPLPSSILLAKSLNVLSLCGFNLESFSFHDIKFPSLQRLHLGLVFMNDHILEKIIRGCPLLEDLQLISCHGLKNIHVAGLLKLKLLEVIKVEDLKMLEIDEPELLVLGVYLPRAKCRVNVKACPGLRTLELKGQFITEEWFHHFFSQCPFLESLEIGFSTKLKNIKISSDTLKNLDLCLLENLVDVEITAPTLKKIAFEARSLPAFLLNASNMLEVELDFLNLKGDPQHDVLAKFLRYFNNFRTVTLRADLNKVLIPKDKRDNFVSPLCGAGNLVFFLCTSEFLAVEIVEYMLWLSPRVRSLSIIRRALVHSKLKKITLAQLEFIYDENNDHQGSTSPCCKSFPTYCWRHCLAEVRVKKFDVGEEDESTRLKKFFFEHVKNLKIADTCSEPGSFCDGLYIFYDNLFL